MKTIVQHINEKLRITKNDNNPLNTREPIKAAIVMDIKREIGEMINDNNFNGHLDLRHIDVSAIKTLNDIFGGIFTKSELGKIKSIDVTGWNVSEATRMLLTFSDLPNLEYIDGLGTWDTHNVKHFNFFFSDCTKLRFAPGISKFNFDMCESLSGFFSGCESFSDFYEIEQWSLNALQNMFSDTFKGCKQLKRIDLSRWNINEITNSSNMFCNCTNLVSIKGFDNVDFCKGIHKTHIKVKTQSMFENCMNLENIDGIEKWDVSTVDNMMFMFRNCKKINADLSNWNITTTSTEKMFTGANKAIIKPKGIK